MTRVSCSEWLRSWWLGRSSRTGAACRPTRGLPPSGHRRRRWTFSANSSASPGSRLTRRSWVTPPMTPFGSAWLRSRSPRVRSHRSPRPLKGRAPRSPWRIRPWRDLVAGSAQVPKAALRGPRRQVPEPRSRRHRRYRRVGRRTRRRHRLVVGLTFRRRRLDCVAPGRPRSHQCVQQCWPVDAIDRDSKDQRVW